MIRSTILVSGFILAFLFASCSPRPIYRMSPQAKKTTFNQGTEYVHLQKNGIELSISYYRHLNGRFVMDVEIANRSDSVFRVDPAQFSYEAYKFSSMSIPWERGNIIASGKAVNPEQELLETDRAIARKIADQKTAALLHAVGQTAYVGAAIAADTEQEQEELEEESDESYYRYRLNQQERELEELGLRDQREIWEIDALRKTDLFPGEYIRGYIFFKNNPDAKGYRIQFDSRKATFNIFFQQKKHEVK